VVVLDGAEEERLDYDVLPSIIAAHAAAGA